MQMCLHVVTNDIPVANIVSLTHRLCLQRVAAWVPECEHHTHILLDIANKYLIGLICKFIILNVFLKVQYRLNKKQ